MNLAPIVEWYCPACGKRDQTRDARPHTRMHVCPKTRFLTTPMVREGTKARLIVREREDYVNGERVQLDPERQRPVMSIVTERDHGQDAVIFAPAARADGAATS